MFPDVRVVKEDLYAPKRYKETRIFQLSFESKTLFYKAKGHTDFFQSFNFRCSSQCILFI